MPLKILAIDTSTDACSAAVLYGEQVYEQFQVAPRQHNELILPMIEKVLAEAGLTKTQLDAVAFGRGPGSFTGLRIAAGVVQGIAFGLELPVVPVSTLQALAQGTYHEKKYDQVMAAIDARINEIYWATYHLDGQYMQPVTAEQAAAPSDVAFTHPGEWVGVGNGWDKHHAILEKKIHLQSWLPNRYPRAQDIALLAAHDFQQKKFVSATEALPVYVQDQVVKEKPNG